MTMNSLKKNRLLWALVLSLAFNLAFLAAFAYTEYRARKSCAITQGATLSGGPRLSAKQKRRLEESRNKLEAQLAPLRAKMANHCRKLSDILSSPAPSSADIQAETTAMADIQRRVQNLILENFLNNRAALPKGQRKYFNNMLQEGLCSANRCGMAASDPGCERANEQSNTKEPFGSNPQ